MIWLSNLARSRACVFAFEYPRWMRLAARPRAICQSSLIDSGSVVAFLARLIARHYRLEEVRRRTWSTSSMYTILLWLITSLSST